MISVKTCDDRQEWDDYVLENDGHPLQLWGWGEVKAAHGWRVERVLGYDMNHHVIGGAQVLVRSLPWPLRALAYVPRGPVGQADQMPEFLDALANHVRSQYRAVVVTIEPDWSKLPPSLDAKWSKSDNTILIPHTLILDLTKTEDELQVPMSKKTRQYIRKSSSEDDLVIRQVKGREYLTDCLVIYHETARRAGFALHGDQYYYDIFDKLDEASPVFAAFLRDSSETSSVSGLSLTKSEVVLSEEDISVDTSTEEKSDLAGRDGSETTGISGESRLGKPVAFLWLAISGSTAFELYGGMNDRGQELRANYALKWYTIQKMKEWGLERYDMNGLLTDGVSTFKRGFADHEDYLVGTYDRPLSPLYVIYSKILPPGKKLVRAIKRK